jgi:DUF1680 family protein
MKAHYLLFLLTFLFPFALNASEMEDKSVVSSIVPSQWTSFELSAVRLAGNSYLKQRFDQHKDYLLQIDHERLINNVLRAGGIRTAKENYGGWQHNSGNGWANYIGSASMMYASLPDDDPAKAQLKNRVDAMIDWLYTCQQTENLGGYLLFNRNIQNDVYQMLKYAQDSNVLPLINNGEDFFYNNAMASMCFYQIHRILAGIRDAYLYADNRKAKEVFIRFCEWVVSFTSRFSEPAMQINLETEHGGMLEMMVDAYALTGRTEFIDCAEKWVQKKNFTEPLAAGDDPLTSIHANATVPKFSGLLRNYQMTGNSRDKQAILHAKEILLHDHMLPNGGHGCRERFQEPGQILDLLQNTSSESCGTYNMLKFMEELFCTTGDVACLDFYERALLNHILATKDPDNHSTGGGFCYYQSLFPGQHRKYMDDNAFYCCWETGLESHAKYGKAIWFNNGKDVLLNLFQSSTLQWQQKGLKLNLQTDYPQANIITLKILQNRDFNGDIYFRCPAWANPQQVNVSINGQTYSLEAAAGSLSGISHAWTVGDEIKIVIPCKLRYETTEDPTVVALFYGPMLLAANMGSVSEEYINDVWQSNGDATNIDFPNIHTNHTDLNQWLIRNGNTLEFHTTGLSPAYTFTPFSTTHHIRQSIFVRLLGDNDPAIQKQYVTDYVLPAIAGSDGIRGSHHLVTSGSSYTGTRFNRQFRKIENGASIQYTLSVDNTSEEDQWVSVKLFGSEEDSNSGFYNVSVDGVTIGRENPVEKIRQYTYPNKFYKIPKTLLEGKTSVNVKFQVDAGKNVAFYGIAIVKDAYLQKYRPEIQKSGQHDAVRYEAEWAQPRIIRNDNANPPFIPEENHVEYDGKSGRSAYVKTMNAYRQFNNIYVKENGYYRMTIQYAFRASSKATCHLDVNGVRQAVEFEATGGISNFQAKELTVFLSQGFNTITLKAVNAPYINIDYIDLDTHSITGIVPIKNKDTKIRIFSGEKEQLTVYCDDPACTSINYSIYDVCGKTYFVGKIDFRQNTSINISSLMTGVYIAEFKNKQFIETIRFIK